MQVNQPIPTRGGEARETDGGFYGAGSQEVTRLTEHDTQRHFRVTSDTRQLEQCLENGVMLDPSCLAQSSQSQLIQNKPDYHSVLRRQRSVLSTVELVMDTQCKMVRELQSRQEQAQLLVNETSSRLAADVGFQYLSSDLVRDLLAGPVSSINQHIIHRIILVPLF
ncbi:kinetochore-associated protein DSN1 homolog isoform X2 [Oncorhynchus kisutch]|uniref:kinetochore-associated protein DSN1 homolog isoform X2 n=1 Tax=Oncorhynchus kisutch TaxID=8019 RepID=UPI0012DC8444|nr:kinetochore-associated protein DSN1 homolog isoform X2 [Oncorhynchus kisutch]